MKLCSCRVCEVFLMVTGQGEGGVSSGRGADWSGGSYKLVCKLREG